MKFQDSTPGEIAVATIDVGSCFSTSGIDRLIAKAHRDLRNRIHASRRADPAWDDVALSGWWSISAGPGCPEETPIWSVTGHLLIGLGTVTRDDVAAALARQWREPSAVQIESTGGLEVPTFVKWATTRANTPAFVHGSDWPAAWKSDLYSWLHGHRRNVWEYLRFGIEPAAEISARRTKYPCADEADWGAMPVVI